jgi:hypothetical protein
MYGSKQKSNMPRKCQLSDFKKVQPKFNLAQLVERTLALKDAE